jgi:nucleoid DNA-binding protein
MTKADLVKIVCDKTGITQRDAKIVVDSFLDAIAGTLSEWKNIDIRGFGRFKLKESKPRLARNPRKPQETVQIPARLVPIFQPSHELKAMVSQK